MDPSTALSGAKTKNDFLSKAHEARQAREQARRREEAATTIQARMRSFITRNGMKTKILDELQRIVTLSPENIDASELLSVLRGVIVFHKNNQALDNSLEPLLKALAGSTDVGKVAQHKTNTTLTSLIICECVKNDKSKMDWLRVLEFLLNFLLNRISDSDITSYPAETQSLSMYLNSVNLLTSETVLASAAGIDCKEHLDKDMHLMTNYITSQLATRSCSKRHESFLSLSNSIHKIIKGPRTDLKAIILNGYVQMAIQLIRTLSTNDSGEAEATVSSTMTKTPIAKAEILIRFLSVPCLMHYITIDPSNSSMMKLFEQVELFPFSLKLLNADRQALQNLTSTPALCVLANLIHLGAINENQLSNHMVPFALIVTKLLEVCRRNAKQKGPNATNITTVTSTAQKSSTSGHKRPVDSTDESYNHILGWLTRESALTIDQETSLILKSQLGHLWSLKILKILFNDLTRVNEKHIQELNNKSPIKQSCNKNSPLTPDSLTVQSQINSRRISTTTNEQMQQQSTSMLALRRAFEKAATSVSKSINSSYAKTTSGAGGLGYGSGGGSHAHARLISEEARRIALVCYMLNSCLKTLRMIRQDILAALCLHDYILRNLWQFIRSLGPNNGMKAFLDYLTIHSKSNSPEFHILMLFCECASHIISILDDSELYEQQKPFTIDDLISVSHSLNTFVFRLINNQLVSYSAQDGGMDPILQTSHKLLTDLYKRDCRRKFAPQDHWLMTKELKMSVFLRDLEQGKPVAKAILSLVPHIIAHKERVLIFRKLVTRDRERHCNSGFSTFITIHRSRLVEDGYQQLARLPPNALKGLIRVKFINDHGLDEAGIDQDGVFKEFLEDTIKRVFDPALNLFSSTSEQRLYPSPTSRLHEDHLSLFNFVGKMLGKAVYEGIVVDVPFASFFLSRVLGQPQSPLYSPIDELPSLDPDLYKSLTYIKHYEGDVSDLDLTFSLDQDLMGKIETYELEPGGKFIPVTKETRVRYIHSVANFRMKTQIEEQTEAFVRGFKSIVDLQWLSMFSASEFQRLISGDTAPIDLQDLRKHTKYFGGFHNSHRVVCWLWDILERDFSPEEHRLFLKFVTSCSKPPLLGFANLEPPFSIRCVEVSDDQDLGDTVGSVLRGFFAIRRSDPVDRLPTSSTCFNLLKLPNYQRRSTLREKLRYAIRSSTGFELS